jgi:flagella basal body P-ring formation protein FlgA
LIEYVMNSFPAKIVPLTTCFIALLGCLVVSGDAAEMRVRAECSPQGAIVTLGDLVDLRCDSASEAERLAKITLFPAPAAGLRRFVSAREIQDMLLVRGIELIDHQFGGATSVMVLGRRLHPSVTPGARLAASAPRLAQQKLHKALSEHLVRLADKPWQIDFNLDEEATRWIAASRSLSVQGDQEPTAGRQCFEVTFQAGEAEKTLDVVADVSLPPAVVVPVRPIPRQIRIAAADLELRHINPSNRPAASVTCIEDLVGKETTRTLAAGKPIDRSAVREPVLVRRGEIVSVVVRAPGIRVRATARARDSGAKGELVAVESLENRRTYFAQVSGVREVEVLATGVTARETDGSRPNQG